MSWLAFEEFPIGCVAAFVGHLKTGERAKERRDFRGDFYPFSSEKRRQIGCFWDKKRGF